MGNKDIETIEYNYDNLEIIKIVKYLLNCVINDIEYTNDLTDKKDYYDLGNKNKISNEDLESIVSIINTFKNIEIDNL